MKQKLLFVFFTFIIPVVLYGQYDYVGDDYGMGLRLVRKEHKYGFIDKNNNVVIPLQYDYADSFEYNTTIIAVKKDGMYGLIDINGNAITEFIYDEIHKWEKCGPVELAEFKRGDFTGCLNVQGEEVISNHNFANMGARISKDGYVLIQRFGDENLPDITYDYSGMQVSPSRQFDWLSNEFNDGLAIYRKNDQLGFVDTDLNIVIPAQFDGTLGFCDGLAAVQKSDKWGFINTSGDLVIPCKYDWHGINGPVYPVRPFFNHCTASMEFNGKMGLIDKKGHCLTGFIYDVIQYGRYQDYAIVAHRGDHTCYLDLNGCEHESLNDDFRDSQRKIYLSYLKNNDDFFVFELACSEKNELKAFDYLFRAVNSNSIPTRDKATAMYHLAGYYMKEPLNDLKQAEFWYRQAAELGDLFAVKELVKLLSQ